jgi:hypothetical protein
VNPSDSQFQDLLKAQQQLNDQRAALDQQFQDDPTSPDYADQIQALDEARDQAYQQVLGTNAFDTLQKQQDDGYSKMKKYENTWGLDDNQIDSVYASIKYYQKSVQDYQAQAKALEAQGHSSHSKITSARTSSIKCSGTTSFSSIRFLIINR